MGKKASGINAGQKLIKRRKNGNLGDYKYKRKLYKLKEKSDPLGGKSQAKALVLEKKEVEAKPKAPRKPREKKAPTEGEAKAKAKAIIRRKKG